MPGKRGVIPVDVQKVLTAWQSGSRSLSALCKRYDITYAKARYWVRRQWISKRPPRPEHLRTGEGNGEFLQLHLTSAPKENHKAQLTFPCGAVLTVYAEALPNLFPSLRQSGLC